MLNYNLRRPTIAEAKAFGKRIGVQIRYSSEWKEFSVGNQGYGSYLTPDINDAMLTAQTMSAGYQSAEPHRNF